MSVKAHTPHSVLMPLVLTILLLTQCKDNGTDGNGSRQADLTDRAWILTEMIAQDGDAVSLNSDENYHLFFNNRDELTGQAHCNSYSAAYSAKDGGSIQISSLVTTEVGCGPQSHIAGYYEALTSADGYQVTRDRLVLHYDDHGLLRFKRMPVPH